MFVVCSIALMMVWLFLNSVFHVPVFVSSFMLSVAFSLYFFDWWMHARAQISPD